MSNTTTPVIFASAPHNLILDIQLETHLVWSRLGHRNGLSEAMGKC
jgi:hypothetical protein